MSENKIDVDIDFHLKDINNLFEQLVKEGTDIDFQKIMSTEGKIANSFSSEIGLVGEKQQDSIVDALKIMNLDTVEITNILKMMDTLLEASDIENENLTSVQENMIMMIGVTKAMIKMLDENYPLSSDIEGELKTITDVLADKEMDVGNKMNLIIRAINGMTTPPTREAFNIISPGNEPIGGISGGLTSNQRDDMLENLSVMETLVTHLQSFKGTNTRLQTVEMQSKIKGAWDAIQIVADGISKAVSTGVSGMATIDVTAPRVEGGVPIANRPQQSTEGTLAGMDIAEMLKQHGEMLKKMASFSDEVSATYIDIANSFEGKIQTAILNIEQARAIVEDILFKIDPDILGMQQKEFTKIAKAIDKAMEKIDEKLSDEMFEKMVFNIWRLAIKNKLAEDPKDYTDVTRLGYYMKLAENMIATLGDGLKVIDRQSEIEMRERGIKNIGAVKVLYDIIKDAKTLTGEDILKMRKLLTNDPDSGGVGQMVDFKIMSASLDRIDQNVSRQVDAVTSMGDAKRGETKKISDMSSVIRKMADANKGLSKQLKFMVTTSKEINDAIRTRIDYSDIFNTITDELKELAGVTDTIIQELNDIKVTTNRIDDTPLRRLFRKWGKK